MPPRSDQPLTHQLATWVADSRLDQLPTPVVERAQQTVADALACGFAGSVLARDILDPITGLVADQRGPSPTLLPGVTLSPQTAAFVNGATIHTIDYDDTHMAVVAHLGASVVPAALAATLVAGGSGADLLAAVVAGFEAGARVGRACMPEHYQRWHATATLGSIAAGAAAARGLGLDAAQTEMVLGLVADDAAGTRVCITQGDISKSLHAGLAAEKGVRASLLVRNGATGPVGMLEHRFGFFWVYSEERDARRLPDHPATLGETYEILHNDIKAHPCILSSHTAIEGVIALRDQHDLTADEVVRIELHQPRYSDGHGVNHAPTTAMAARLSVPYCVAVAFQDGEVGMAQFTGDRWFDDGLRSEMAKVVLEVDESLRDRFPGHAPTRTVIVTSDGGRLEQEVGLARGSHARPMTAQELATKHEALLSSRLGSEQIAGFRSVIDALPGAPHLGDLGELLSHQS